MITFTIDNAKFLKKHHFHDEKEVFYTLLEYFKDQIDTQQSIEILKHIRQQYTPQERSSQAMQHAGEIADFYTVVK